MKELINTVHVGLSLEKGFFAENDNYVVGIRKYLCAYIYVFHTNYTETRGQVFIVGNHAMVMNCCN